MANQHDKQSQDAFHALAALTFADQTMSTVMERVAVLAKQTVPGAHEVSVTLVENGKPSTIAFTGQLAVDLDERQYQQQAGPCLASIEHGEPVVVPSMRQEQRWPRWTGDAVERGVGSSLSIPVPLQPAVEAALNIYSTQEHAFGDEAVDTAQAFGSYAAVALANMHLYATTGVKAEQLQTAMTSRAVIEQAKGILMGERRCTADEAFQILADLSQRSNRKLRDVAEALVENASSGT